MLATVLRPALVMVSVAWVGLLPLVPWLASRPHVSPIGAGLLIAAYAVGGAICHQLPERSYHLWTAQMPVCARCAGIYFGAAVGALVAAAPRQRRPTTTGVGHRLITVAGRRFSLRAILLIAVLPTLATIAGEWMTGCMPAHWLRASAGVPIGITVAWAVLSSLPRRTRADNQVN